MASDYEVGRFRHVRNGVKVCSIVILIIGIIAAIYSIFIIVLGPLVGVAATEPNVSLEVADEIGYSQTITSQGIAVVGVFLTVMGIVTLVAAVLDIVMGGLGLHGAKYPDRIGPFWVLSIVSLVIACASAVTSIVMGAVGGSDIWGNLFAVLCSDGASIVFDILCVYYSSKVRDIVQSGYLDQMNY